MRRAAACWALALVFGAGSARAAPRVFAVDGAGAVMPASGARASLQRTPPSRVPADPTLPTGDPDALRYLVVGPEQEIPSILDVASVTETGEAVSTLRAAGLSAIPCPPGVAAEGGELCAVTDPIRVVADGIDATHPLVISRSVEGQLGGGLRLVGAGGVVLATVRIAGPRHGELAAFERLRGRLRVVAVRLAPGGALPVGGTVAGARRVAVAAVERVNSLWGACGVSFGPPEAVAFEVVDPPPSHLLAVGCDHGLPASGGELRFRVLAGKRGGATQHVVAVDRGMSPAEVARRVAGILRRTGWRVTVTDNPPISAGAGGTSDISVRSANGELARFEMPMAGKLSTDPSLEACIGEVNLEDGLQHFTDVDSMVGTVEERSLIKAYDDHDPTSVDVYLVAGFGQGGRIGESFIGADGGSLRNVVIIDRAGIRTNRASFTLAHELGHVLLDDPGHPDDYGVDLPTRLMDADAADGSAFGPRRLSLAECARALRQSGPGAPIPLLEPWPLGPLTAGRGTVRPLFAHEPEPAPWLRSFF